PRIEHFKQARVEGSGVEGNFFPLVPRHSSLSVLLALWDHLSESRDGNRRPFESAIHTLGQRRVRRGFKWQRSTPRHLPRERRGRNNHWGLFFAREHVFPL